MAYLLERFLPPGKTKKDTIQKSPFVAEIPFLFSPVFLYSFSYSNTRNLQTGLAPTFTQARALSKIARCPRVLI